MFSLQCVTSVYVMIITAVIVAIMVIYHYKRHYLFWKVKGVPGPVPFTILGNALPFITSSYHELTVKWVKHYGLVFGYYDFLGPVLMVSDPKILKQICVKDFHFFSNRREMKMVHKVFEEVMFGARDKQWKRLRKLISPTFTTGKIKRMKPLIESCVRNANDHLEMLSSKKEPLNVKQFWSRFTLEVIARCCFAMNINSHNDPSDEFLKHVTNFFKPPNLLRLIGFTLLVIMPYITRKVFKFQLVNEESIDYVSNVTHHLLQQRKKTPGEFNDFFQLLIDAGEDGDIKSEASLTESEIVSNCFLFFVAGYETTASLLTYFSYSMALNTTIQEKLYEEISNHFPDEDSIDYDIAIKLPYLDAVVSETLRMYPPITITERVASTEVELQGTGIVLPANTTVQIPVYAIHHNPLFYPEPEKFKPERFLGENRGKISIRIHTCRLELDREIA